MSTIQFELTKVIKYANGSGDEVEANFIDLKEPTGKHSHICCEIESLIQEGIIKMSGVLDADTLEQAKAQAQEKPKDDDEEKMDRDSVLSLMSSGGVDMKRVVLNFRELFKQVAIMGGEKPLTTPRMDEMSHKDFKNMMGEYASNFILS